VTPFVTREVVLQQRLRATRLFLRDLYNLLSELAISYRFSPEMEELADNVYRDFPKHKREKYRRVCGYLIQRLVKTARECESELAQLSTYSTSPSSPAVSAVSGSSTVDAMTVVDEMVDGWQHVLAIHSVDELMKPLRIMYDSLVATGFELLADGLLADIIRRLAVFGCSLVPLDIREESTHHTLALDALTRWLGIGSYKEWSEEARLNWLNSELASKRPLFGIDQLDELGFDDDVKTTLKTFKMASELRTEDLGAYVISQAQTASDVLAVMLLQKQFGMGATSGKMMRVVPLFETLNDLTNAPQVLDTLFSIPLYIGAVRGKQEVMVGYSDSAKDAVSLDVFISINTIELFITTLSKSHVVLYIFRCLCDLQGRLSACWAQYVSQENMSQCADKHGVELTFFHGKGGTVGRGGNPSVYRAIMSHPPNTINGRFRVTEQGEMIAQNFGAPSIAERTLDIYTAAVCREAFVKHVDPSEKWRRQMEKISQVSCDDYRYLVREEPRFVPYFRQATPELELGSLNIGSRPAKRKPQGGIESLRAIPWTFAWAQTRTHLSAWLGVGAGLQHDDEELKTLREMYKEWPWFRETIDLIAMIVSKTDYSIAENYDKQLVDPKDTDLLELGVEVREKLVQTRQAVLDVTESKDVAGAHVALMRASSTIRHPYVDPVNVIQAELLKRVREMESRQDSLSPKELEDLEILKDALVISINGIAQGMRNSG
jgi:phosphoenolpyruvate carboxylase